MLKDAAEVQVAEKAALLIGKADAETKLNERLGDTTLALECAQRGIVELRTQLAALQETLDQGHKQSDEKIALLRDAKEQMTAEFKILAGDIMKLNSESFMIGVRAVLVAPIQHPAHPLSRLLNRQRTRRAASQCFDNLLDYLFHGCCTIVKEKRRASTTVGLQNCGVCRDVPRQLMRAAGGKDVRDD